MLEKRLPYFVIGLAAGAGVLALVAPKSGRVYRGKKLLAKSGTKVRRSAADLLSRGKGSLKHVNVPFKGAMEAGRTAFSVH